MRKGFTLIEMLVVVIIIGVLIAIGLPQYQKTMNRSKYGRMKSIVRTLMESEIRYYQKTGSYPNSLDLLDVDIPRHKTGNTRFPNVSGFWDLDGIWVGIVNQPVAGSIFAYLPVPGNKIMSLEGYAFVPLKDYGNKLTCLSNTGDGHCKGKLLVSNAYGKFYDEEQDE